MMRDAWIWAPLAMVAVGCASSRSPSVDSETHWLSSCAVDGECGTDGLSCVCGTCTRDCSSSEGCGGAEAATCVDVQSQALVDRCGKVPIGISSGICLAECDSPTDCPTSQDCVRGACLPATMSAGPLTADAGAGAPASDGGTVTDRAGDAGISDAASRLDPHAAERRQTAASYCALLDAHECLSFFAQRDMPSERSREELIELCRRDLEVQESALWGDACFDEWRDVLECFTTAPWICPCAGDDCLLPSPGQMPGPLGGVCNAPHGALFACQAGTAEGDNITGSTGECRFSQSSVEQGCSVVCDRDVGIFEGNCTGPVGGAQTCLCVLNGVALTDPATSGVGLWADDCLGATQAIANGYCERIIDCCFTWQTEGRETCTCTSDPRAGGFDSCEAAAAAGGGEVVDLCPQYQLTWGFPEP